MKAAVPTSRAAGWLAALWLAAFACALAVPTIDFLREAIEKDTFEAAISSISDIYAPYIGTLLAYFFVRRMAQERDAWLTSGAAVSIALFVSFVWNLIVLGILFPATTGYFKVEDSLETLREILPKLSWLVAPAIGYFFARTISETPDKERG